MFLILCFVISSSQRLKSWETIFCQNERAWPCEPLRKITPLVQTEYETPRQKISKTDKSSLHVTFPFAAFEREHSKLYPVLKKKNEDLVVIFIYVLKSKASLCRRLQTHLVLIFSVPDCYMYICGFIILALPISRACAVSLRRI